MSAQSKVVALYIDGHPIGASDDQTILETARNNGIDIPTLCHLKGLTPWGACRICVVELKGNPKLLPACTVTVAEGMEILTRSDKIDRYRKMLVEMLFAERNHFCAVCVSNGGCDLQSLAQQLGIDHVRMPYRYPKLQPDVTHDLFRMDHNRCILCARCIRVCAEVEGAKTKGTRGIGIDTCIITDLNTPWGSSESCTSCGKCVQVCPTGALVKKGTSVAEMQKQRAFLPYLKQMRRSE